MTDVIVIDVMGGRLQNGSMNVGEVLEQAARITARRQTELAIQAFAAASGLRC